MPKYADRRLARLLRRTSVASALVLGVATTATAQQWVAAWGSSMQSAADRPRDRHGRSLSRHQTAKEASICWPSEVWLIGGEEVNASRQTG